MGINGEPLKSEEVLASSHIPRQLYAYAFSVLSKAKMEWEEVVSKRIETRIFEAFP